MSTELRARPQVQSEARVLPHDIEAEQSALGSLFIDPEAIQIVRASLRADDFYVDKHGLIYQAACDLCDRGEPIDVITLHAQLTKSGALARAGDAEYLGMLSTYVPTAANVKHYAEIVVGCSIRRKLITAGGELSRLGFDDTLETQDALDTAEQKVFSISDDRREVDAKHIANLVKETWDELETRMQKSERGLITGVPTNFTDLDRLTQGLQPGELIILAARPGVGKTSFALNAARNASVLAKKSVAIFSLEMTKSALVKRLICSEAGVDSYAMSTNQLDAADFQRIAQGMDRLTQANLWIDDTPNISISTLRARARRMKSQYGIDLLVVDYLQMMRGGRTESRVQEVSDISAGLKGIAKELNLPVLALSQLSRESERREVKKPQLSDLRDSGSIEQDADVVLFLYRPGLHEEQVDKSLTKLIVAKNRNGPTKELDLIFVAEQTSFREPYRADN